MRVLPSFLLLAATVVPAAAADADHGKTLFQRQCAACHQVAQPRNGVGPSLQGVVGRPAASVQGFTYSPALKGAGLQWTSTEIDAYLTNPTAKVPGTRMAVRVASDADRGDIIAFLQQNSSAP
ncbi:c-type cytochrome [Roseomonas elaeocarpi]|uniref:C-type cytochrome n=1 Tax=Roseomonas elaeocarpi TaxID=907779 RepID=A0ABV6JN24_9PROT